jgi:hypothetical protein
MDAFPSELLDSLARVYSRAAVELYLAKVQNNQLANAFDHRVDSMQGEKRKRPIYRLPHRRNDK